ncbi:uncharacterized protein LOC116432597 [Nomia melanderi]|uniref:uncharacterized protein LOC116432597 n=1 Tax=Nomia melanderi TaxID=2448451 RepID=UPI003FCD5860
MTRRRSDTSVLYGSLLLAGLICRFSCQSVPSSFDDKAGQNESKPRVFSPRMDYDEWTPLGRGDPLKNNPTFDYVPPVLDRVQYWLDSHTTESSAKRDVLVLGVTAKKTSPKIPEQFLKFVDGPKFTKANQEAPFRNDFTGSSGAEPPKLVRTTSFRNGPPVDYRNQNRIQSMPASYYPSPYYGHKSKPYTMMLPPPLLQKDKIVSFAEPTQQFSTQTEEGPVLREPGQFYAIPSNSYNTQYSPAPLSPSKSHSASKGVISQVETIKSVSSTSQPTKPRHEAAATTPSVSFEKSNLIYQSTQTVSGGWPAGSGPSPTPSTASDANRSVWQAHDRSRDRYELDHHVAAGSSTHEVVVEQNANIIVDADGNENEEVVVGQKESPSSTQDPRQPDSSNPDEGSRAPLDALTEAGLKSSSTAEKMHIVLANSSEEQSRKEPVAVVMPSNYSEKSQDSVATPEPEVTVSDASTTVEPEAQKSRRPEPVRAVAPSVLPEDPQQQQTSQFPVMLPNRMMPHRQHASPHSQGAPVSVPRQPAGSGTLHAFGFPQAPLQSMMHPQPRPNHAMMQFLGGMRPGAGFRLPSGSVPMFPPMTHMHAPPPAAKQTHHAMLPPALMEHHHPQEFSMPFTESPASSLTGQLADVGTESKEQSLPERHRTTPLLPTVSPTQSSEGVISEKNSLLGTIANKEREEEGWGKTTTTSRPSTSTPRMTTVQSLTTDPIFSHYKQPAKPIRGPMYLIIQGHSKVKTYKPTVTKHGVPVAQNEIAEAVADRQLSKFEQFVKENTRSGNASVATAEKKKAEEKARAEKIAQARQNSLMSLLESGLGSFAVSSASPSASSTPSSPTTTSEEEHQPNSVTTIEINGN